MLQQDHLWNYFIIENQIMHDSIDIMNILNVEYK